MATSNFGSCFRTVPWVALALFCALVGVPGALRAEPAPLGDQELDAISAAGFSIPSFSFGGSPAVGRPPERPGSSSVETAIDNRATVFAPTITVNTVMFNCVFADCAGATVGIDSTVQTENHVAVSNDVAPIIQTHLPVGPAMSTPVVAPVVYQPTSPAATLPISNPSVTQHNIPRVRPPLPKVPWGVR